MNKKIIGLLSFTAGLGIGSAVTFKYVKDKYEKIAQNEIDSVKEYFKVSLDNDENDSLNNDEPKEQDILEPKSNEEVINGYNEIISNHDYTSYSKVKDEKEDSDMVDEPYVISPDDYGSYMDYEQISLTYYADGVLTDEDDIPVEDVESTVGLFFADHFGEYEDDSVFVRNDTLRCEYEILSDTRNYSDVVERFYK